MDARFAERLRGATKEELEADADALFELVKPDAEQGGGLVPPGLPTERLRGGGDPTVEPDESAAHAVPAGGRFLAVAPDIATRMLKIDKFSKMNESGSPSALRDAVLRRLYGMTVVESNALDAGSSLAYHRSGFAFATLSPANPRGAASSAQSAAEGIALRVVFDYATNNLTDLVGVSRSVGRRSVGRPGRRRPRRPHRERG